MPATYIDKLKLFHDTFVKYVCSRVEHQRIMDYGVEVPSLTNSFRERLQPVEMVPVVNIAALALELWNGRGKRSQEENIKALFPIAEAQLKQLLSEGIQIVAINFELTLDETEDLHKIGFFASEAATKFLNNFQPSDEINAKTVSNIILKQNSWSLSFRRDDIFSILPPIPSNNYYYVFETDLVEYINRPQIPSVNLSQFLRIKYNLPEKIQIILKDEVSPEIKRQLDITYLSLNGYEFDTEIFKLDRLEASLQNMQAVKLVGVSPPPTNSLNARLKKIYSLQDKLPQLINDDAIPTQGMDNYHVRLELKEHSTSHPIEPDQIFTSDSQDQTVEKVLLIAESGMGKSAFVKNIAYNWGKHNLFDNKFTYLFKIDLQLFFSDWSEDYSKEDLREPLAKLFSTHRAITI